MNDNSLIQYRKHDEVDFIKYDRCINSASNSRVYAAGWYLDRSAIVWDALVWGNYEFVMPIPVGNKYGIRYLYQPVFSQQLGIFPSPDLDIAFHFYREIRKRFRYAFIHLNSENPVPGISETGYFFARNNFLLSANKSYQSIFENYSKNTKRNLGRAESNHLNYVPDITLKEHIEFTKDNMQHILTKKDMDKLKSIISYSQVKGIGEIPAVYDAENRLCATVFFCRWKNRITYLNAVSDKNGKDLRGMFLLIDRYIRNISGNDIIIDFEGSMIPGVARFFKGFGATTEKYKIFRYNSLPLPVRWLKSL
jgi:hypothetical protein